ncbi:hypothetical protein PQX77_011325 [Marasmius sp. AFHP31]|nr:hypothetical protein PQX77_011325 [Marasmius sp. AFHP31]
MSSDSETEPVGFGRPRMDSSSSRESSPGRKKAQKRSFSPTSDDDVVITPIVDDDTPPPEDRPLLRQALAFAGSAPSTSTQTYEASSSTTAQSRANRFLPGQTVEPPPKPKRAPKKRKPRGTYEGQSNKFRLTDPPPIAAPLVENPGPTTTQFSAFPMEQHRPPASYASAPTHSTSHMRPNATPIEAHQPSPTPTLSSSGYGFTPPPTVPPAGYQMPQPSYQYDNPAQHFAHSAGPSHNITPSPAPAGPSPSVPAPPFSNYTAASFVNPAGFQGNPPPERSESAQRKKNKSKGSSVPPSEASSSRTRPSQANPQPTKASYYRRNYDEQTLPSALQKQPANQNSKSSQPPKKDNSSRREMQQSHSRRPQNEHTVTQTKHFRMVTILMTDLRGTREDNNLVEVSVPLKPADLNRPEDGFWTQAEDVVRELQASLMRIQGEAEVYTMRSKYRQVFMRTSYNHSTQETIWEGSQANLAVSADRTLTVVVVKPPRLDGIPSPPPLPSHLRSSPSPEPHPEPYSQSYSRSQRYSNVPESSYDPPESKEVRSSRKRGYSSDSPSETPPPSKYVKTLVIERERSESPESEAEYGELMTKLLPDPNYPDPEPDADPDTIERCIVDQADRVVQLDNQWNAWFSWKHKKTVAARVKMYRFIKKMADQWVGRRVPFQTMNYHKFELTHILQALLVNDDPKIGDECMQTLELLDLYGPEGTRSQDPQVIQDLQNEETPSANANLPKRFLKLLRRVDADWQAKHSAEADRHDGPGPEETSGHDVNK